MEDVVTISKKVRVRLSQASPCNYKDMKDQFLTKLQKRLLSQEVCNFPCKIFKPQLRCRIKNGEQVVAVNFEIQLDQNVISTSKYCNDTCVKCQMEERLQRMIIAIRSLMENSKLNVSVYDRTITVTKKSLRVTKESDYCSKEKAKRKTKRLGKNSSSALSYISLEFNIFKCNLVVSQLPRSVLIISLFSIQATKPFSANKNQTKTPFLWIVSPALHTGFVFSCVWQWLFLFPPYVVESHMFMVQNSDWLMVCFCCI